MVSRNLVRPPHVHSQVLYHSITFIYLLLGGFLVYTGVKVAVTDEDDDDEDPTQGRVVQWLSKRIPLSPYYDRDGRFFVFVNIREEEVG